MSLFDVVDFGPEDVRAVVSNSGSVPRCVVFSVLTSQTCGEPCWHAKEEVCRCSCGGKNHGCLLIPGGTKPERTAKIDGVPYRLLAVGERKDLVAAVDKLNRQAWKHVGEPELIADNSGVHGTWKMTQTERLALAEKLRAEGKSIRWSQYRYTWTETDAGAPGRLKNATAAQLAGWEELKGWRQWAADHRWDRVCLAWQRMEMPAAPIGLIVDKETGLPLANQLPEQPEEAAARRAIWAAERAETTQEAVTK